MIKKLLAIIIFVFLAQTAQAACALKGSSPALYVCLAADPNPVAAEGARRYNSDNKKLSAYLGGAWSEVTDPAKQVTGGNSHDHTLGAGAKIKHSEVDEIGVYTHPELDTHLGSNSGHPFVDWLYQADTDRFCSGVVDGGTLTPTSGNLFNIAAGHGYINDHTGTNKQYVSWGDKTGIATIGNGTNYVGIHADGTVDVSLTRQAMTSHIYLGHLYAASGNTVILETWNVPEWTGHFQGRVNDWMSSAVGVLVSSGTTASERENPNYLELDIASGTMYARLGTYTLSATNNFTSMYHTSDYDWVPDTRTVNHVNTTEYNNYTGTYGGTAIVTMTVGYWKKDMVLRTTSGNVYYLMAQAQYSTEDLAKAAALPTLPPAVTEDSAYIITIVSQKGDTTIANRIYDIRPNLDRVFGYGTTAGGSTIDHATLTHLDFASAGHTGFASTSATSLISGTLDGDRLPALSSAKRGGVPATGTPANKFLRDDDTWQTISAGGAPTTSKYLLQQTDASLPNAQALGALSTGLVFNTTTTGVQSIYGGTSCTNQFPRSLSASGAATCASVADADITGTIAGTKTLATGAFANATTYTLGKSTPTTVVLDVGHNGTSALVNTFHVADHPHSATAGTGGQIATSALSGTISDAQLANNYSGVGACTNQFARTLNDNAAPTCAGVGVNDFTANQGTTTQVLHGNAAGQPSWGAIAIADLPTITVAKGGSNLTTVAADQVYVGTAADTFTAKALPACANATTSKLLYDTTTHAFSCGTDQTSGTSALTIVYLSADHAISSTTATEVTGLQAASLATGTYTFKYMLLIQSATSTVGVGTGINFTGTATMNAYRHGPGTGQLAATGTMSGVQNNGAANIADMYAATAFTTTTPNMLNTGGVATINVNNLQIIEGVLIVTVTGNLALWHSSETATSTTIKAGSSLVLTKVN